jgi:hypothetical protein
MRFVFSGAPQLPYVISVIYCVLISGALDITVMKEFAIVTESTMLNNLQSMTQENRSQLLDSPETDL